MGLVDKVVSSSEDLISEGQLMAKLIIALMYGNKKVLEQIINKIYSEGYEDGINCVENSQKEGK